MNKWHKIVGIIVFAVIGIYELLLWAFAITDWEDTPLYNCINNLSVALWLNYFIALCMYSYDFSKLLLKDLGEWYRY